jgi:hypothetical protein
MSVAARAHSGVMSESSQRAKPETTQLNQLLEVSTTILEQALDLLENYLTHDEQLTVQSKYVPGSTIGAL